MPQIDINPNITILPASTVSMPGTEVALLFFDSDNSDHLTSCKNVGGVKTFFDYESPAAGTVTTFSSGNLAPLFTTSVATPGTTPALSFSLTAQLQNLVFASPDGAPGVPSFRAIVLADLPALNFWSLNGNTLGNDTTWAGSIDNFDYSIRTNSLERLRVLKTGEIGIGSAVAVANRQLNVVSTDITAGNIAGYFKGSTATVTEFGLVVADVADTINFYVANDGSVSSTLGYWIDSSLVLHLGFMGIGGTSAFFGENSGLNETVLGNGNVGVGRGALQMLTDGVRNVAIGYNTLTAFTGAGVIGNNVAIGWEALRDCTTGENVVIGSSAGPSIVNGNQNTIIGQQSANALISGIRNTLIGAYAEVTNAADSQSIAIGRGATITGDNQLIIGSPSAAVTNAYIGTGATAADATANLFIGTLQTTIGALAAVGVAVRLGTIVVAASVLDGTQYIEHEINGVVYKLALIQ